MEVVNWPSIAARLSLISSRRTTATCLRPMPFSSRRPLLAALIISLLLHAALLLSTVSPFAVPDASPPARTISALLGHERRSAPPAPAARSESATPAGRPAPTPTARPAPRAPPVAAARDAVPNIAADEASAVPAPAKPAVTAATSAAREGGPAAAAAGAPATAATAAPAAAPSGSAAARASAGDAVSADDLRQYSVSLGLAARRFKRYPALARERGWEGRAEVELIFSALLPRPEVALARSSGRAVLDEQAVNMMTQAASLATLPDGLRGRSFRLLKAVEFSLEGDR